MGISEIAITAGTLVGYVVSVTGVNVLGKKVAANVTKKNSNKKIYSIPEEERTDDAVANIIAKESRKNNVIAALATSACSVGLGVASIAIINSTGDTTGQDTSCDGEGADAAAISPINFYYGRL
jgi:hypothetical protein